MTAVEQTPITWRGWLWRAAILVALIIGTAGQIEALVTVSMGRTAGIGVQITTSSLPQARWLRIAAIQAGGPAEAAGIEMGDSVRFDSPFVDHFLGLEGDRLSVTVDRDGRRFHTVIVARARVDDAPGGRFAAIPIILTLVFYSLAILLLVRGRRKSAPLVLASLLALLGYEAPTRIVSMPIAQGLVVFTNLLPRALIPFLLVQFSLEIAGTSIAKRTASRLRKAAAAIGMVGLYQGVSGFLTPQLPGTGVILALAVVAAPLCLVAWVMMMGHRGGDAAMRNRIQIVTTAFACLSVAGAISALADAFALGPSSTFLVLLLTGTLFVLSLLTAALLLVYAVLSRKLFDFGFAINRTLVYGAVSFSLLAAFGLAEWGADRLVPQSWHKQSALYSAGVALLLFLSFHRVRDWFEHHVERLFFARWQQAEAELKRFVASAGHFEQAPALCRGYEAALARFAGAEAAVYLRGSDGSYRLQCGGFGDAPAEFADDDPAFALMRAEREPLDLTRLDAALPGALALPMLDVGALTGFVLLGPKPDGAHYRPDEIDNLGWAAHQVGLDLQALHARELEAENASLREKLAWLSAPKPRRARTAQPLRAVPGGA